MPWWFRGAGRSAPETVAEMSQLRAFSPGVGRGEGEVCLREAPGPGPPQGRWGGEEENGSASPPATRSRPGLTGRHRVCFRTRGTLKNSLILLDFPRLQGARGAGAAAIVPGSGSRRHCASPPVCRRIASVASFVRGIRGGNPSVWRRSIRRGNVLTAKDTENYNLSRSARDADC